MFPLDFISKITYIKPPINNRSMNSSPVLGTDLLSKGSPFLRCAISVLNSKKSSGKSMLHITIYLGRSSAVSISTTFGDLCSKFPFVKT